MTEQLVLLLVPGPVSLSEITGLDDELRVVFADGLPGEYDGFEHQSDGSMALLYFYGADAEELFVHMFPELAEIPLLANAEVRLRSGPSNQRANERNFLLSEVIAGAKH